MNRKLLVRCVGLALAGTVASVFATPAPAQQATPDTGTATAKQQPKELKTVVVTAERRQQNLQDVPSSVTALGSGEINQRRIQNVTDLSGAAPDLIVAPSPASGLQAQLAIRGSAQVNPAPYFDTPVPMYVDGIYYGKATGAVFDLVDLERIEVLHGPQGTLYGRNAYAGAVNFITHTPTGIFNGRAELDIGNYNGRTGKVAVDLPAIGKLKISTGGVIQRADGWITTTPGSSVPKMNNTHKQAAFIDVLLDATRNLSIEYRLDHHDVNQSSRFGQVIRSNFEEVFGIPGVDARSGRRLTGGVNGPIHETMGMDGQSLHVDWKLGEHNTLKYIAGHRREKYRQALDLDGTILPIAATQYAPFDYVLTSNELQWLGQAGPFDWVAGLYHFSDHGNNNNPQTFFFGAQNYDSRYGFATTEKAAYAQVDYRPTDRLTFTVGGRRSVDKTRGYRFEMGPGIDIPNVSARTSAGAFTPMASASFKLTPTALLYTRYAEGFKSGGFNGEAITVKDATTPYKPEKKKSYEAGVKSTLLGGRLRLNADVYYERNSDLQESVFTAEGSASSNIVNVGKSHDEGLELEAEALVSRDLTLRMDYSYLHERYDTFMVLGENVADNRAVVFAPRHMLSLVADSTFARVKAGDWHALVDYRYSTGYYQYPYQLRLVDPTAQLAANTRIPAGGTLNAQIALQDMDWGHNVTGQIAFWVHNLTNSGRLNGSIDFGPAFADLTVGYFTDPRTFGVSLIANF